MGCGNSTPARGVSSRASSSAAPRASPLPPRPPRRLPRRFAPPAPRRRGFALEFSAPSYQLGVLRISRRRAFVRAPDRVGRGRVVRGRARARTIATAPSRAAANERARSRRSAPRSGRSARRRPETSTSPRSSARSSASDPPVETRDSPTGTTNHPGPQTRVERASTRSSEPSPTTLATGASSPRRASSRDATRSWGAAPPTRRGARRKKNL